MKKKLASTVIACSVAVTQISDIAIFADSSIKENINKDKINKEVISSEKNTKKETKILDNSNKNKVVDIKDKNLKELINKTLDIDTLPIAKARGFLVANTLIYT